MINKGKKNLLSNWQIDLSYKFQHFKLNVLQHPKLRNLSSLSKLCHELVETNKKKKTHHLVDKLIYLVLTLLVSTYWMTIFCNEYCQNNA